MATRHPGATLSDPQFLAGLDMILEPYYARNAPQDEIAQVVQRAEAFFLSSQAPPDLEQPAPLAALSSVPPAAAQSSSSSSSSAAPAPAPPAAAADPPYPPTFAELAALIASGAPIPGVRDIPDELAPEPPSEPQAEVRRKPWEVAAAAQQPAGSVGLDGEERVAREKQERAEESSAQV